MKRREHDTFWSWLRQLRMRTLLLILVPCLLVIPLVVMWMLPVVAVTSKETIDSADTARRVLGLVDWDHLSGPEIRHRIEELLRIKDSVRTELRALEQRRAGMLGDIQTLGTKIEKLRMEESRETKELERLKVSIEQVKIQQKEFTQRNTPDIAPPLPLLAARPQPRVSGGGVSGPGPAPCSMAQCWDYSRCSVTSRLPVFPYPDPGPDSDHAQLAASLASSPYLTRDAARACVHLALDPGRPELLDHWAGDGRNHLLVLTSASAPPPPGLHASKAVVVSSAATMGQFRPGYDIVIPPLDQEVHTWDKLQPLVPVTREYLLEFQGHRDLSSVERQSEEAGRQERRLVAVLQDMKLKGTTDKFLLSFSCGNTTVSGAGAEVAEWRQCGDAASRRARLVRATWCLVLPPPAATGALSSAPLQARLRECLLAASVPVILGADTLLPFAEVVDWSRAALILPAHRVTELHLLLRTFQHADIFAMKRQGRLILETYLSSSSRILATVLDVMRQRLAIPGVALPDTPSPSIFNSSFTPLLMEHLPPEVEPDESLGRWSGSSQRQLLCYSYSPIGRSPGAAQRLAQLQAELLLAADPGHLLLEHHVQPGPAAAARPLAAAAPHRGQVPRLRPRLPTHQRRRGRRGPGVQPGAGRQHAGRAVHRGHAHLREGPGAGQLPGQALRPPLPQQGGRGLEQSPAAR